MYCQKCRTPLKLDKSLEELNPAAFDLLVGATGKSVSNSGLTSSAAQIPPDRRAVYDRAAASHASPVYKRSIPGPSSSSFINGSITEPQTPSRNGPDMSFVMLTDSQLEPPSHAPRREVDSHDTSVAAKRRTRNSFNGLASSPSEEVERATRLFSILSARSDIDHPICTECTDILLTSLQNRLQTTMKERDAYVQFYKSIGNSIPSAEDVAAAKATQAKAEVEKEQAFEELLTLEAEKQALDAEIAELEEQSRALDAEEAQFWASRNAFSQKLVEHESIRDALDAKVAHDSQQLEILSRTNVYNDTFNIGHDGYFGTINGLRLGRLPNHSVEWSEINAAWGQTLLLLATIAEKLGFRFQGYKLIPMGSTSRIEKIEYPQQSPEVSRQSATASRAGLTPAGMATGLGEPKITSLDLFSSGDVPLGRLIHHRRFDAGMVAFLECLAQLGSSVDKLPYPIKGDKIGDPPISIRLGAGFSGPSDESWTKACKCTLTCCKYLLAHTSNVVGERRTH